jgi:hypothetical protein
MMTRFHACPGTDLKKISAANPNAASSYNRTAGLRPARNEADSDTPTSDPNADVKVEPPDTAVTVGCPC